MAFFIRILIIFALLLKDISSTTKINLVKRTCESDDQDLRIFLIDNNSYEIPNSNMFEICEDGDFKFYPENLIKYNSLVIHILFIKKLFKYWKEQHLDSEVPIEKQFHFIYKFLNSFAIKDNLIFDFRIYYNWDDFNNLTTNQRYLKLLQFHNLIIQKLHQNDKMFDFIGFEYALSILSKIYSKIVMSYSKSIRKSIFLKTYISNFFTCYKIINEISQMNKKAVMVGLLYTKSGYLCNQILEKCETYDALKLLGKAINNIVIVTILCVIPKNIFICIL